MKDQDIRSVLKRRLAAQHLNEDGVLILEELSLCQGDARADVVVVNGLLNGFEIKSDQDTLVRLQKQLLAYNRVFDNVTLVVGRRHATTIHEKIPEWWGITEARSVRSVIELSCLRHAAQNPAPCPHALAEFLWRNELLRALEMFGIDSGVRSKSSDAMRARLVANLSSKQLSIIVRQALKSRQGWKCDPPQTSDDDSSPRKPMSPNSRSREFRRRIPQCTRLPN